ncbi:MAG: hypothetical protein ACI9N0_002894 [Ilumatobacter sp.]|jgi:hypothetical protein
MKKAESSALDPSSSAPLRVARAWLASVSGAPDQAVPIDDADVRSLVDDRLAVIALDLADRGWLRASSTAAESLSNQALLAAQRSVALEARCGAVVELLDNAGIATRVLKGLAVAQLDYPDPALRLTSDIDLLVKGDDIHRAIDRLAAFGFERHFDEPFDGFDTTLGKGAALEGPNRFVIDLHRTLALGYYGVRLPVDLLWENPDHIDMAGVRACVLPKAERFAHAALHLALAPHPRMMHFLDLAVLIGNDDHEIQSSVIRVADEWGCPDLIARAVMMSSDLFQEQWEPPGLVEWAQTRRPGLRERLWWSTYQGRLNMSAVRSMTSVAALRPVSAQPRALTQVLFGGLRGAS